MNRVVLVEFKIMFYFLTFPGTILGSRYCTLCDRIDHSSAVGVCLPMLTKR